MLSLEARRLHIEINNKSSNFIINVTSLYHNIKKLYNRLEALDIF